MYNSIGVTSLWYLGLIDYSIIISLLTYFCLLSKRRLYFVQIGL